MAYFRIEKTGPHVTAPVEWRMTRPNALARADMLWNKFCAVKVFEMPLKPALGGGTLIAEFPAKVRTKPLEAMIEDI